MTLLQIVLHVFLVFGVFGKWDYCNTVLMLFWVCYIWLVNKLRDVFWIVIYMTRCLFSKINVQTPIKIQAGSSPQNTSHVLLIHCVTRYLDHLDWLYVPLLTLSDEPYYSVDEWKRQNYDGLKTQLFCTVRLSRNWLALLGWVSVYSSLVLSLDQLQAETSQRITQPWGF